MEVDTASSATPSKTPASEPTPEGEIYLRLLILFHLLASPSNYDKCRDLAHETVERMQTLNRRSMDPIAAKVWYAVERVYELRGELAQARPYVHSSSSTVLDTRLIIGHRLFFAAQRTASLRHDEETEASLLNRLLRCYIEYSLYDQADKLVSKTTFPESASNAQCARYYYYLGRIKAVQLNYTAAHTDLQQAIRRAPPPKVAPGFYQAVHKLVIVVELLMGDIPQRSVFRHPVLEKALTGYFEIVKGV